MASGGGSPQESDLRIILIGPRDVDMASTGNTILGTNMFGSQRSSKCIKRDGEVAGRKITVVATPNRWSYLPLIDTTGRDKQEMMLSMLLCDPGPHAILLLIGEKAITKEIAKSMEEHTELLGYEVWDHTILLYSYDNQHEECVQSAGEAFRRIAHKCRNRYHVLNNRNHGDSIQVTGLLKKIDMLQENKGKHCEIGRKIYFAQKWRDKEDKWAEQRLLSMQNQRKMLRSKMENKHHISEMRILLTGYQYSGKSSTGNTILAKEAFPIERITECQKSQGDVQGRHITIVDTPGRWRIHQVKFTSELLKQDIVLSAAQCPPGPHVLLVLVRLDTSFTENNRRAMEGHLQLLGENVWRYAMVLFTCGDFLKETMIEQFIESEGEALQWLVNKCNNRYHVFNNNRKDDCSQVSELLEKIEEVVVSNDGGHFEMDQMILQEVQNKRKVAEDRARKRRQKAQEEQKGLKVAACSETGKGDKGLLTGSSISDPEFNIVLIGYQRAGKTKIGNIILDKDIFPRRKTLESMQQCGLVAGRCAVVVDTPGWNWEHVLEETPALDWQIVRSVQTLSSQVAPIVFLLVLRAAYPFKDEDKHTTEAYLQVLGDSVWNHTIVLFTTGGFVEDVDIEQHIESEGDALQWLIEKCVNRYHVLDTTGKKKAVQVPELMRKIEQVVANNKGCPFQLDKEICEKVEKKYLIASNRTSQRTLKECTKYGSMKFPPPNMSGDDQASDYGSYESLLSVISSTTSSEGSSLKQSLQHE